MLSRLRDIIPDKHHRMMWKTFSTSIGMLTLAMMAALYSSSARRDGRGLSTAISALIALAIAVWVGVRFVPRLAGSVNWRWLPFSSHYHVTQEGWIYFATVTVVVFAAINTSNNLLYMVLSVLLAVLVLSGFLSGLNFRDMRIAVRIPGRCFAGEPFAISIQVHNEKRVFPSLSLQLEPADAEIRCQTASFYLPVVQGQQHTSLTGQAMLSHRGRHAIREVRVSSRYPFGFFLKSRAFKVEAECICYPAIIPREVLNQAVMDAHDSKERFERGPGYDLYTIRDYVGSDSARHVHWKASAKAGRLKTREYAAEERRRVVLLFDRFGRPEDGEKFEQLVSRTASLAYHMIQDGVEVSLVSDDWQTGWGRSEALSESILRYLALVKFSAAAERPLLQDRDGVITLSLRG